MRFITEAQAGEVGQLENQLIRFYNTCPDYTAFSQPSDYPALWSEVLHLAGKILKRQSTCRILEVGAGRSGFGRYLRDRSGGSSIHLTSQDITTTNEEHLRANSDAVVVTNLDQLVDSWDIIFHSYAYEHLCRPVEFNETLWRHLNRGGYLAIQSPRYDCPFYLPPCFDHLPRPRRLGFALRLLLRDLTSLGRGGKDFTLFSDPAVFHLPFHRDRDAIHRVRKADLRRLFAGRASFREFPLPAGGLKDFLVKRFLTLRVILHKLA